MTADSISSPVRPEVKLVQALIIATKEVLGTMANVADVRKISVSTEHNARSSGQMAGVVDVNGTLRGWMALDLQNPLAKTLTAQMLEESPESLSHEDIQDCVKELANMISGSAKKILADRDQFQLKLSIPIITASQKLPDLLTKSSIPINLAFEADGQPFWLLVSFVKEAVKPNSNPEAKGKEPHENLDC